MSVAFVIVSHSDKLAEGVVDLAGQMARDVQLRAAGGTDDGRIGTSFDKVSAAVAELRASGHDVAILTDLGSANMTVEAVVDFLEPEAAAHVRFCDGPLVEGAVAAGGELRFRRQPPLRAPPPRPSTTPTSNRPRRASMPTTRSAMPKPTRRFACSANAMPRARTPRRWPPPSPD